MMNWLLRVPPAPLGSGSTAAASSPAPLPQPSWNDREPDRHMPDRGRRRIGRRTARAGPAHMR